MTHARTLTIASLVAGLLSSSACTPADRDEEIATVDEALVESACAVETPSVVFAGEHVSYDSPSSYPNTPECPNTVVFGVSMNGEATMRIFWTDAPLTDKIACESAFMTATLYQRPIHRGGYHVVQSVTHPGVWNPMGGCNANDAGIPV